MPQRKRTQRAFVPSRCLPGCAEVPRAELSDACILRPRPGLFPPNNGNGTFSMTCKSSAPRQHRAFRALLLAGAAFAAAGASATAACAQSHADHHRPRLNLVQAQTGTPTPSPSAGHGAHQAGPAATAPAPAPRRNELGGSIPDLPRGAAAPTSADTPPLVGTLGALSWPAGTANPKRRPISTGPTASPWLHPRRSGAAPSAPRKRSTPTAPCASGARPGCSARTSTSSWRRTRTAAPSRRLSGPALSRPRPARCGRR